MELAKVTSKGQITLPISIRRALGLKQGDKVAFIEQNGQFVLSNPDTLTLPGRSELDMESVLDETDRMAEENPTRYSMDEAFGMIRSSIHG